MGALPVEGRSTRPRPGVLRQPSWHEVRCQPTSARSRPLPATIHTRSEMAMPPQITADVLEAFLHCRYKGHLKQDGQTGTRSETEALAAEQRAAVRQQAIERVTARHADGEVTSAASLT